MGTATLTPFQRVANGVDWLNEHAPAEWWDRVDLDNLSIDDPKFCVLGQVFAAAADEAGIFTGYHFVMMDFEDGPGTDPIRYGFCPKLDAQDDLNIEIAWLSVIDKIRVEVYA